MRRKRVIHRRRADEDIENAIAYYLSEAGVDTAASLIDGFEDAMMKIARNPATGSPRYGHELSIPGLRHLPIVKFPYLIFYLERDEHIEILRVLHGSIDIPSWLSDNE